MIMVATLERRISPTFMSPVILLNPATSMPGHAITKHKRNRASSA